MKHTDLVVLGKVTGMRLIPQERSTSITSVTLKVESVIKGDKVIKDRPLPFRIWEYKGKPIPWVEGISDRLFMTGLPNDCYLFQPDGARVVTDNKVYIPYTYKEMTETHVQRYVERPVDLVVKVAQASIKDYDAITVIKAGVAKAVSLQEEVARPRISVELLRRLESTADYLMLFPGQIMSIGPEINLTKTMTPALTLQSFGYRALLFSQNAMSGPYMLGRLHLTVFPEGFEKANRFSLVAGAGYQWRISSVSVFRIEAGFRRVFGFNTEYDPSVNIGTLTFGLGIRPSE